MTEEEKANHSRPQTRTLWIKPAVLLALLVAFVAASQLLPVAVWLRSFLAWVEGLGPLAPVALGGAYVIACVLFIPGSILTLGAGLLFGVVKGTITVSISATLGATVAFLIARYGARDMIARRIRGHAKFEAVDKAVAREGWKIVGLTRLSPIFPFNVLNYAFGLTQVSLKEYFFASWVGMLPGTVLYVYIGSLAGDVATLGAGESRRTPAEWALYIFGLVVTLIVAVYVTRVARKALQDSIRAVEKGN